MKIMNSIHRVFKTDPHQDLKLKFLTISCEESSIPNKEFYFLCLLIPQQAPGNALTGIQSIIRPRARGYDIP